MELFNKIIEYSNILNNSFITPIFLSVTTEKHLYIKTKFMIPDKTMCIFDINVSYNDLKKINGQPLKIQFQENIYILNSYFKIPEKYDISYNKIRSIYTIKLIVYDFMLISS